MKISVVIPTLNEERTIAETLRLTTSLGFDEIIVVDGGSTDRTRAIVTSFQFDDRSNGKSGAPLVSRISQADDASRDTLHGSRLLLEAPPGRAGQLNAGANVAQGDALLFLHADTHLPSSARCSIEAALADRLVVGGRFDVQFDIPSVWGYLIAGLMNVRSRLTRIATGDQALFVRKEAFERLGGFADIPLMEDIEFSVRLKRSGATIALRDRVTTSFRRWQRQGPLKTILLMWMLRLLYWTGISPHRLTRLYTDAR